MPLSSVAGWCQDQEAIWNKANLEQVGLVGPPAFYLELAMDYLGGEPPTHMALKPVFLDYRETAAKKISSAKKKDLLFAIQFKTTKVARQLKPAEAKTGEQPSPPAAFEETSDITLGVFLRRSKHSAGRPS